MAGKFLFSEEARCLKDQQYVAKTLYQFEAKYLFLWKNEMTLYKTFLQTNKPWRGKYSHKYQNKVSQCPYIIPGIK